MSERKERCETCRFFEQTDDDTGQCRRYAPAPRLAGQIHSAIDDFAADDALWPVVSLVTWCGEWQEMQSFDECPFDAPPGQRIVDMDLPARVMNCLRYGHHDHEIRLTWPLSYLTRFYASDLLEFRNFGQSCLRELRAALGRRGLYLRGEAPAETTEGPANPA